MECRAEINRFAIFLFCLLAPLGSMAPTEKSESKMTKGQRQNNFTPEIPTYASVIQQKAQKLFDLYNKCNSEPPRGMSKGRKMAEGIPQCQAFQADCCALHHIRDTLQSQRLHIESICTKNSTELVDANLSQLNTTLSHGTAFYTCSSQDLPQGDPQGQTMGLADRKTYIWWVLKKYKDIMEFTRNLYSDKTV